MNSAFPCAKRMVGAAADGCALACASQMASIVPNGSASATLNQLIFNGSYIVGLQAANTYKDLALKTSNQTKEQIVQQVMKAYYGVLINRERTELFANNIARVDSLNYRFEDLLRCSSGHTILPATWFLRPFTACVSPVGGRLRLCHR